MLTGSILKVQTTGDILLFDSFGKIIGVSQEFFEKRVKQANPSMTLDRFIEQGHIFLLIPYLIVNMKKYSTQADIDI